MLIKQGIVRLICGLALAAGLVLSSAARADSVNSPNVSLNVDANRSTGAGAGNVAISIGTITVAETMLSEYTNGSGHRITLRVRPGYEFDHGSDVSAISATFGINGAAANAASILTPAGGANEVLNFNLTSGGSATVQDIIRFTGIKIKILDAAGAAGPAQTTMEIDTSSAGGAFTNQGIVAATIVKGLPDRLVFSTQPGNTEAGSDLLPAVKIVDFGGNTVTNSSRLITLAIQSNPLSTTLAGNNVRVTSNGVATWIDTDDLRITGAAAGYTLRASHDGANFITSDTVDSSSFEISSGPAGRLVFTSQPFNTVAGESIVFTVGARDQFNNPILIGSVPVTIDLNTNAGAATLLVNTSFTKDTAVGVANWNAADGLRITLKGTGYQLTASGVGLPIVSNTFNITAGAASGLHFVQQPVDSSQNVPMNPAPAVEIVDSFGNRTDAMKDVVLSLNIAPCGGNLAGASILSSAGLATFNSCSVDTPCAGNQLKAAVVGLPYTESELFAIAAGSTPPPTAPFCGVCGAGALMSLAPIMLAQIAWRRRRR